MSGTSMGLLSRQSRMECGVPAASTTYPVHRNCASVTTARSFPRALASNKKHFTVEPGSPGTAWATKNQPLSSLWVSGGAHGANRYSSCCPPFPRKTSVLKGKGQRPAGSRAHHDTSGSISCRGTGGGATTEPDASAASKASCAAPHRTLVSTWVPVHCRKLNSNFWSGLNKRRASSSPSCCTCRCAKAQKVSAETSLRSSSS